MSKKMEINYFQFVQPPAPDFFNPQFLLYRTISNPLIVPTPSIIIILNHFHHPFFRQSKVVGFLFLFFIIRKQGILQTSKHLQDVVQILSLWLKDHALLSTDCVTLSQASKSSIKTCHRQDTEQLLNATIGMSYGLQLLEKGRNIIQKWRSCFAML